GIGQAGGSRWEDWSNIAQDPTDDCTFWYFGGYGEPGRTGGPFFGKVGAFSGAVASFSDSDLTAAAGDFSARIDWGDGSSSDGVVSGAGGSFAIAGSH